jgi:L-asparaginase
MLYNRVQPKLIIHGGAGSSMKGKEAVAAVRRSLHNVIEEVYDLLLSGAPAGEAVVRGCQLLEDDPALMPVLVQYYNLMDKFA